MTQQIITEVSAEVRITLPDGQVVTASSGEGSGAEGTQLPALPAPEGDQHVAVEPEPSIHHVGANGGTAGDGALAELPPELADPDSGGVEQTGELPPPSVAQIEAMVAAADLVSDGLPPEVLALEAMADADSASMEPPDVSDLKPTRRSTRKRS